MPTVKAMQVRSDLPWGIILRKGIRISVTSNATASMLLLFIVTAKQYQFKGIHPFMCWTKRTKCAQCLGLRQFPLPIAQRGHQITSTENMELFGCGMLMCSGDSHMQ